MSTTPLGVLDVTNEQWGREHGRPPVEPHDGWGSLVFMLLKEGQSLGKGGPAAGTAPLPIVAWHRDEDSAFDSGDSEMPREVKEVEGTDGP